MINKEVRGLAVVIMLLFTGTFINILGWGFFSFFFFQEHTNNQMVIFCTFDACFTNTH